MPISEYLKNLRKKIGHDLVLMPGAGCAIFDAQDRLLMIRIRESGRWSIPGGAVDPGETPARAAVREAYEETGLTVELIRVLGVFGGEYMVIDYTNGDRTAYVSSIFEAKPVGGELRPIDGEADAFQYYSREEALQLDLVPTARHVLRYIFEAHATGRTLFDDP